MRPLAWLLAIALPAAGADGVPRPAYHPCDLASYALAFTGFPAAVLADGTIPVRIEQWLAGSGPAEVRVEPSLCAFLPGRKVLVYAAQAGGSLVCREAKSAELAARDLEAFAVLRTGRNYIRGVVVDWSSNSALRQHAGAMVFLEGERHAARTTARGDGSFEVIGLPAGIYRLSADDAGYRAPRGFAVEVKVPEFGCVTTGELYLEPYGVRERAGEAVDAVTALASRVLDGIRQWTR